MTEINVNKVFGKHPNEVWLRTGQFLSYGSGISILGFSVAGIEQGPHTELGPFVILACGILMMIYGTKLRRVYLEKTQKHEIELAKAEKDDI